MPEKLQALTGLGLFLCPRRVLQKHVKKNFVRKLKIIPDQFLNK
jgi:hypothetical protein